MRLGDRGQMVMGDIGTTDRYIIKKRLELKKEELLFKKKQLETELLINQKEIEKLEEELKAFKDI